MNERESRYSASSESAPRSAVERFRRWWRAQDPAEQFLAAATDLADLERRIRALERASGGPGIVTFNP
jgi:Protein of unknown function (DUF3563)